MYGIIEYGITTVRVCFGPLPIEICFLYKKVALAIYWYAIIIIGSICATKFMFICVWKRMRIMNDRLLSRFVILLVIFISIWVNLIGSFSEQGSIDQRI